jgi:peptide/nickel transport system substrate-binding protein
MQLWAVLLLAASGALAPAWGGGPPRDTVVIGMTQEPDTLGLFSVMDAAGVVESALFASAAPFTDRWVRRPLMVEKLPTLKDGDWVVLPNKKMRVTWKLRRGFTWHDGRPVTALDWRFTYGVLRNPAVPLVSRAVVDRVENVLVPNPADPYTLVVQWKEPDPFAGSLPFGGQYALPRHVLEPAYLRDPARLRAHPYWRAPVGNAPYRFVEWVPGSHLTLEADPRFPLGAPPIRRVVFRFILDSTVLQANQITGGVDATTVNGFDCQAVEQIVRRNAEVRGNFREGMGLERIDFNLDNAWLRDRRVRQAIAHAVDRPALAELSCAGGRQPVAHTWLTPRHPAGNARVQRYEYDPPRARALLAEAGFVPGPDGILRDSGGRRLELTIMTTAGNALREQIEVIMKEELRQVGIDLRIDNRPAAVFLGPILRQRQFPHLALYRSNFTPEAIPFQRFHSSQIPTAENNWSGDNRAGWRNAENDRIWEQLVVELDEARRLALLRRQQEIFAEDLPTLPLFFPLNLTTAHRRLAGIRPTGLAGSYLTWNIWEWRWVQ